MCRRTVVVTLGDFRGPCGRSSLTERAAWGRVGLGRSVNRPRTGADMGSQGGLVRRWRPFPQQPLAEHLLCAGLCSVCRGSWGAAGNTVPSAWTFRGAEGGSQAHGGKGRAGRAAGGCGEESPAGLAEGRARRRQGPRVPISGESWGRPRPERLRRPRRAGWPHRTRPRADAADTRAVGRLVPETRCPGSTPRAGTAGGV